MNKVIVLDCETTGVAKTDQVIELAYAHLSDLASHRNLPVDHHFQYIDVNHTNHRFYPNAPIHQEAFNCHGIGLSALEGYPNPCRVEVPQVDYIVGHNVATFDKRLLSQSNTALTEQLEKVKYIDTIVLARAFKKHVDTKLTAVNLDYLAGYYYPEIADALVTPLHSARNDILKTMLVLVAMIKDFAALETWEDLYQFQETLKKRK